MIERSLAPAQFSPGFRETLTRLPTVIAEYFPAELAREYDHQLRMMRLELMLFEHTEPLDLPGADVPS